MRFLCAIGVSTNSHLRDGSSNITFRMFSPVSLTSEKPDSKPLQLNALVLYEDIITGELGRDVARQHAVLEQGQKLKIAAWDAGLLHDPAFSRVIAGQAANAAMIIVAIRTVDGFTASLKSWINRWTVHEWREHRPVLVAVQESHPKAASRVPAFVETTACPASMYLTRQRAEAVPSDQMAIEHDLLCIAS